jgi:hypothetical protein
MKHYCQRRKIDDGIRLNQQPAQADRCGEPANNFIIVYGEKQSLCPWHYDDHMETRSFLYTEGENLDAEGKPL